MDRTSELINTIFSFSRCMREKSHAKSKLATMSMVQLQTLIFLAKNTNSSMKDIALYLHIELPSATSLVEHLLDMGFVMKKADVKDKRVMNVSLTQKGKKFLQKAKKEKQKHIEGLLVTLTDSEKNELLHIMQKLTHQMEGHHEK